MTDSNSWLHVAVLFSLIWLVLPCLYIKPWLDIRAKIVNHIIHKININRFKLNDKLMNLFIVKLIILVSWDLVIP